MPENNKDKNKKEEGSVKFEESPLDKYYNLPLRKEKSDLPDRLGSVDFTYGNTDYGNSKYDEPNLRKEDIESGDYQLMRGENQNGFAQLGLGVLRAASKAGVEALKSPAYLYSLGEWGIRNAMGEDFTLDKALDNAVLKSLESVEESIKDQIPVYKSLKAEQGGLLDNIMSTSFWASEGADGLGYLLGMMGPGAALKAVNLAGKISKLGVGVKTANNIELGTQTLLNTFIESGAEAKGVIDRLDAEFNDILNPDSPNYNPINPKTGDIWTEEEINEAKATAGRETLFANFGILLLPNLIMNKSLLGRNSNQSSLLNDYRDVTGKLVDTRTKKSMIKEGLKSFAIGTGSEGFLEEGGQTTVENYEINRVLNKTDLGFVEGTLNEYLNTLATTEGQKSIFLGSVMGGFGNVAGSIKEERYAKKIQPIISKLIKNNFEGFSVDNDVYKRDENGVILLDENNKPIIDNIKASEALKNLIGEIKDSKIKELASLDNDKTLHDYIAHNQFTRYVIPFIEQGEIGMEILNEHLGSVEKTLHLSNENTIASSKQLTFEDTKYINNLKQKAKELEKVYNNTKDIINKKLSFLDDIKVLPEDEKYLEEYKNKLINAVFQENSKQIFFKEKIRDLDLEQSQFSSVLFQELPQNRIQLAVIQNEIQGIDRLLQQSIKDYEAILDPKNHEEAIKDFIKDKKIQEENITKVTEEINKNKIVDEFGTDEDGQNDIFNGSEQTIDEDGNIVDIKPQNIVKPTKESSTKKEEPREPIITVKSIGDKIINRTNFEDPNFLTPEEEEFRRNNSEEIEKYLEEKQKEKEFDSDNNIDTIVSEAMLQENPSTEQTEINQNNMNNSLANGFKSIAKKANVIMMKIFNHTTLSGIFKFTRDKEGLPSLNESYKGSIDAINKAQIGDIVEYRYVTLDKEAQEAYDESKKKSVDNIIYNITKEGNSLEYSTTDLKHGFDDRHIGIFDKEGNLLGYVQQPHAIALKEDEDQTTLLNYRTARQQVIAERKALIERLDRGEKITTKIKQKDSGNLYTKLNKQGKIDLVNDLFSNSRDKDKSDGNLIFVFNNGNKMVLPKLENEQDEIDIKDEVNKLPLFGNSGNIFQLVKDSNNQWKAVPVYLNGMNEVVYKKFIKALKTLSNDSFISDIISTLNPFIYTSDNTRKAPLIVTQEGDNKVLTLSGIKYNLEDLKSNKGLTTFKEDFMSKRQNLSVTNINSYFTQQELKENGTLATNVLQFHGEYFVQPYIELEGIIGSQEERAYSDSEVRKDNVLNDTKVEEGESLIDKIKREKREKGERLDDELGFSTKDLPGVKVNRKDFKSFLNRLLPGMSLSNVQELAKLRTNIKDAFGAYRNQVIYLFENATDKTSYHEAFHGVFRNLLSNEERFKLIEEAIGKFSPPTQQDLDYLQEGLSRKATPEQLTYLYYEEKLADEFANVAKEFIDNEQSAYNKLNSLQKGWENIKNFFKRILQHYGFLTNYNSENVESVFNSILQGKFAYKSLVAKKNNIQLINKELTDPNFQDLAFQRHPDFTATFKYAQVKNIANEFMKQYYALKSAGINKISSEQIFNSIYNKYQSILTDENQLRKLSLTDLERNLPNIIKNFDFLKEESKKYLDTFKIKFEKDNSVLVTNDNEDESTPELDEEVTSLESHTTKGLGEMVSQPGVKSASGRLKMLLATIPAVNEQGLPTKDNFGFEQYEEFGKLYYFLERRLTGLNTLDEMFNELKELSFMKPELSILLDKLTNSSNYNTKEELTKIQNDFKANFTKQQLNYTLVKFNKNRKTQNISYEIFDANRMSIKNVTKEDWLDNLNNPNRKTIAVHKEDGVELHNTPEIKRMLEQWDGLTKLIRSDKIKQEVINKFLNKLGIELSPEVLKHALSTKKKTGFILDINNILAYYKAEKPTDNQEKEYRKSFDNLVNLETSGVLIAHTQSFNNVEKSNIYTIQLPSYASKLFDKITNKKSSAPFNNLISEFEKDPYYKHSNLLAKLKSDLNFRVNQFRINYLDGFKDKNSDKDGSKFTNMSPKDFMSMQIALFQNAFTRGNNRATSSTSKYVYITPSDKTMSMIFDGVSYNAKLNKDNKIDVNTPIVENFYNVFLQEAERIKQQLEVKRKVENGELDSKKLLEFYHYLGETFEGKFNGQAYQFNQFGLSVDDNGKHKASSFNGKFLNKVITALEANPNETVEDVLEGIKNDVMHEIAAILNKEYEQTLNEAVENGVIRETKDNEGKRDYAPITLNKSEKSIRQQIADFSLNTWLNNIEMSNLLNGDVALYKPNDLQKRTYQSQAMGVNLNSADKPTIKTLVVNDYESNSNLDYLKPYLDKLVGEKEADRLLEQYNQEKYNKKANNVTDAQVFVSPEFYKSIHEARGTWTNEMQLAYDIAEGNITNPTKEQLELAQLQLSNIKPYYFGNRFDEDLGIQRYEQVKCAMFPLFKSYIKSNPLLQEKREQMDSNSIDMIAFESSFKGAIGYRESIDSSESYTVDLDTNNFMIQVDNPQHILEAENDSIRQLKMLIPGNINPDVEYNGIKGSDIIKSILDIEGYNIKESLENFTKLINNPNDPKFKEFLREMLTKRNASENILESLEIVDNEFKYPLDNGTLSTQIENLISSLFTNNVIKQKFEGGSAVQATSLGYQGTLKENQDKIDSSKELTKLQTTLSYMKEDKDGKIWCEAIMPAWSKEFFGEDGKIRKDIPDELKQLLIYRIPTEGFHSMMAIKVVDFLPEEYGNTILLPYEVTTQFGADFDFDKIYFFNPSFKTNKQGNLVKRQFNEEKGIGGNSRGARNNKILDNYLQVLTSKEILPLILEKSGFDNLVAIKKNIDKLDNIQSGQQHFFSSRTQRNYKDRNHVGIMLKGILALHVTGHSYGRFFNLKLKQGTFSFNGVETNNLSKLYDLNDNKLISKEVSSMMAAVLDDIKNPIVKALGINRFTADIWATIVRAGYNVESAINLLTQPSIIDLSKRLEGNIEKIKSDDYKYQSVDTLKDSYMNIIAELYNSLSENNKKIYDGWKEHVLYENYINLNDKELEYYRHYYAINKNKLGISKNENETIENLKYFTYQNKVLTVFNNYDKIAKDLVKINRLFGINKEIGPNYENIIDKVNLIQEISDDDFSIEGLDTNTIENIPSLNESLNTNLEALEYFDKFFPYDSERYTNVKLALINAMVKNKGGRESFSKLKLEQRSLINKFVRSFDDSKFFSDTNTEENKKRIITEVPKLISDIKDSKNDEQYFNGQLRKNVFIESLDVKYDKKNEGYGYITLKANKLDLNQKNIINEAIGSLYDNPKTKPIILDLIKYSFISTGFNRGLRSFQELIPIRVLEDIGYTKYRKDLIRSLNKGSILSEDSENVVDQLVRNFPNDFTQVFEQNIFDKQGNNLILTVGKAISSGRANSLLTNFNNVQAKKETPIYIKYLRVWNDSLSKSILYKKSDKDNYMFEPISTLGKNGFNIEINSLGEINNSIFSENNLDFKKKSSNLADSMNNENQIDNEENMENEMTKPALETEGYTSNESINEDSVFGDTNESSIEDVIKNMNNNISEDINNLPNNIKPC